VAPRLAALVALLAAVSAGPAAAETLRGSVAGSTIGLRHADGRPVAQLTPGPHTFVIEDRETIHNFHVLGTPVRTPVDTSTGTFTFADVPLAEGSYVYRCDIHPEIFGTFGVDRPPAPSTPPASVARVRAATVRGNRVVVVSLRVMRRSSATAQLRRTGRLVAGARRTFAPGRRSLRLVVPRRAPGGLYALRVTLRESGKTFVVRRTIRVPAPPRRVS
jgi:hypothetical protein